MYKDVFLRIIPIRPSSSDRWPPVPTGSDSVPPALLCAGAPSPTLADHILIPCPILVSSCSSSFVLSPLV